MEEWTKVAKLFPGKLPQIHIQPKNVQEINVQKYYNCNEYITHTNALNDTNGTNGFHERHL